MLLKKKKMRNITINCVSYMMNKLAHLQHFVHARICLNEIIEDCIYEAALFARPYK